MHFLHFLSCYEDVQPEDETVGVVAVSRCFTVQDVEKKEDDQELPESLQLHQMVVRKIGEICRIVNQVPIKVLSKLQSETPFKRSHAENLGVYVN